jgi:trigger factor
MATVTSETLPKKQVKLTITVPLEEVKPYLDEAAAHLSEGTQIPGFRPGKADFDSVKRHVGEMKIYEEALEPIVRKTFTEAVMDQKLETVGSPEIGIDKLAPGNDLVYTAKVTLMPNVEKLADYRALSVKSKPVSVSDDDVSRVLRDLQRMQTKETRATATEAATNADKAVVNMNMKKDGVPLEGGQAVGHSVYLNESYYIPGFAEQIVGMKEGEEKSFELEFPKEHYQKNVAGQKVTFDVALKELYHLDHPTLDDAFASSLGQKDLATLKQTLHDNLKGEKEEEESHRLEREMLETVAKESRFEDVPDLLLNEEINKMLEELKRGAAEQGLEFDTYLKGLKKTLAELKLDLTPQALMRVKVALLMREIAKRENVEVSEKELDEELDRLAERYEDKELRDRIYSPIYRDYVEAMLKNRKVVEILRAAMLK